ncbi:MAG: hypothetical protein ACR2LL_10140 [Nitrosopumilus sp.]
MKFYSQIIPVQMLNKGENAKIVLKIFEAECVDTVEHAKVHFGPYDDVINGITVEDSLAHLVWHNDLDGEIIGIYDENQMLQKSVSMQKI